MNLPFKIARRYLLAKKSTNAINVITGISVFGITIQVAAFTLVLSVFNGFEDLLLSLFSNFNPEIKIEAAKGKTFSMDTFPLEKLQNLQGVEHIAATLEEIAFFEYHENQAFGIIKGVDSLFRKVTSIDSTIIEGVYATQLNDISFAVLGNGMKNQLGVDVEDNFTTLNVYMPKIENTGLLEKPFTKQFIYPAGTFAFQQDFDNEYIITNLQFVQRLLEKPNLVSAIELKLSDNTKANVMVNTIQTLLGDTYKVRTRYQQDEAFLKLMNMEKWMSFAILTLTLLLVAFNLIGSLWMIVLEKKQDIAILKSMGSLDSTIQRVFLYEGGLLCLVGLIVGFVLAFGIYFVQKAFGIIPIPEGFVVDAYPMSIRWTDFLAVTSVVFIVGLIASLPAAYRAKRIPALIREE